MRSKSEIDALLRGLSPAEMADMLVLLDELDERKRVTMAQNDFLAFIGAVDANYKFGAHLKRLGSLLMGVEIGSHDRIAVSMAPRFGKSQMISIYYPAWYLGKHPDHKVIVASHTADLAVDMARKVRNLMQTDEYRRIFPDVAIAADAKAAGKWNTNKGGEYYATGVGGALAGRGGHLIIVDDPLSEQDIKSGNTDSLDTTYEWFRAGLRTRLMPEGRICILHTRWHQRDLIGRLTKDGAMNEDGDQYEIFEFPAILNEGTETEKSLWPEQWPLDALLRTKASMPAWQWNAQYQQNPTAQESAIIKKDWIQWWPKEDPPPCDFLVQSFDTALTTKERSDYSVCQTWGVFKNDDGIDNAILLNCVKGKWEFPELKAMALEQYQDWQPDSVIVEAKASGQPLIDEMRRSGLFVQDFSPGKGQDKIARVNAVSDMFASGQVWFPETRWATEVVEEILAFPAGEHDDQCFVAGTQIYMASGITKRIDDVRVGDLVATPYGPKQVTAVACTGVKPVVEAAGLTGTPNHPVATLQGWVPLGEITRDSAIIHVSNFTEALWLFQQNPEPASSLSSSMGTSTTDTPTPPAGRTASITPAAGESLCIGRFGSSTMGPSQKDGTSTTRMETQTTTALTTSNACRRKPMRLNTETKCPCEAAPRSTLQSWIQYAQKLLSGIAQKRGVLGIESTLRRLSAKFGASRNLCTSTNAPARSAEPRLFQTPRKQPTAGKIAGMPTSEKSSVLEALQREPGTFANGVGVGLPLPLHDKNSAARSVSTTTTTPRSAAVYNLSVADAECYFANGVLVHNCDAMTLALARVRKGGILRLNNDYDDNPMYNLPSGKRSYY